LAAEDNAINRKVLRRTLERLGYTDDALSIVNDGGEAVAACVPGRWDIVLMDIQMPVLCGNLATEMLHQRYGRENMPPIVALTANMLESQTEQWLASGMVCVLGKPINVKELENVLSRVYAATGGPGAAHLELPGSDYALKIGPRTQREPQTVPAIRYTV
jgi:two-component system aerobic respiration control sensor histidine kinase ArcB